MDQRQTEKTNKSNQESTTSYSWHGNKLCDTVYLFHEPEGIFEVEIVFIHGLQLAKDDFENAYWRTWLVRDGGTKDNCWPMTWLPKEFPNARILSLSYDACAQRTPTTGRMDLYLLGESLVQQMTSRDVGIGQSGCPVVFVCHSVGGLVAKQIIVSGQHQFSKDKRVCKLLGNLKAFFFYATPHGGSKLANLVNHIPFFSMGPFVKYLEVLNEEVGRLNSEFEQIHRVVGRHAWKFYVVGEMQPTSFAGFFNAMAVEEASARYDYPNFIVVASNHIDVCKPKNETDAGFQHLTRCINEVVEDVNKDRGHLFELQSFVVGMEDKLQKVWKKMEAHSIVGLVGMAGIGKTTLSKHLYNHEKKYNHERNRFERFCFLEDIKSCDIKACRRQLFHDLCDEEWDNDESVNIQQEKIKQCIMLRKVFLVFDNVGSEKNMKDLQVHAFKNAQNGSKAIVTTQRRQVLLENYCDGIFDVDFLNEDQASKLFSFYAFHGVDDEECMQLGDQAKAIIKACGGLPLSLEVIGQFLRKYNSFEIEERMPIWEEALRRLQEAMPFEGCDDEELWATLKISYDDLAKGEQHMFLDFACIICETWSIDYKFRVRKDWLARIWNSPIGVQNLINMSLIKWNDDRQSLVIHESLRDMGRGIVKKALVDGNMSRIWRKDDGLKFTLQNKNLQIVEGLVLGGVRESEFAQQLDSANRRINMGGTSYFEKLRLLDLRESDLKVVEYYVQLRLEELTWLCLDWTDITISSIKALGSFTKLRILEMTSCIELEQLPTSINNLSLLTELHLHSCKNLKTLPETIGNLKNLQILMLRQCRSLERLPTSIGGLKSLKSLDCGFCTSLTEVPAEVGQLFKLEYLSFGYCPKLKTLCKFETKMDRLRELNLLNCRSLETIKWLGNLHRLQILRISGNLWIDNLPDQLGQLSKLHELDLRGSDRLDKGILETIQKGQLCTNHLVVLGLSVFPEIGLPPSTRLKKLHLLTHGNQMEKLPESLGNLSHLEYLNLNEKIDSAYKLKVLPNALCKLELLTHLEIENLHLLEELHMNIGHLSSLQWLTISNCTRLVELPSSVGNLFQLQRLELKHCKSLKHLPETLKKLTRLSYLGILNCIKLQCWESNQSSILRMLKFIGCKIQRFYDLETNRSFLQLIDVEADRDVIVQFIEEVQSQLSSDGLTKKR